VKILKSEAINQIFHVASPLNEPKPKRMKEYEYFISKELKREFEENVYSEEFLFDIGLELKWFQDIV